MADEKGKEYPLSIILRTVDKATAPLKRINERFEAFYGPFRKLSKEAGTLGQNLGLDKIASGFRGVVSEVGALAVKLGAAATAAAGLAAHMFKGMVDEIDQLADASERAGVTVDFLNQLRFAAGQSGAEAQVLDKAVLDLSKRMGEMRANTGSLVSFVGKVSPALLKQLKATKSNEEALLLLSDAMKKLQDPAKRTALATQVFGDAGAQLVPLLMRGSDGIKQLMAESARLTGPLGEAAEAAGGFNDSLDTVSEATKGLKASVVSSLAPVLRDLVGSLTEFIVQNRPAISAWLRDFGQKLPARIDAFVNTVRSLLGAIKPVWEAIGGMRGAAIGLAAILGGKLILAVRALGVAMLSTPIGQLITGISGLVYAGYELYKNWHLVKDFFIELWDGIYAKFSWFFDAVKFGFLNFTPIGLIIKHWQPIKDFFVGLWDGIVGVFKWAWDFIAGIIDAVVGGVDAALQKVKELKWALTGGPDAKQITAEGLSKIVQASSSSDRDRSGMSAPTETKLVVAFENAPKGIRVSGDGKVPTKTSIDYQMVMP